MAGLKKNLDKKFVQNVKCLSFVKQDRQLASCPTVWLASYPTACPDGQTRLTTQIHIEGSGPEWSISAIWVVLKKMAHSGGTHFKNKIKLEPL